LAQGEAERAAVEVRIAPGGEGEERLRTVLDELLSRLPVHVSYSVESAVNPHEIVTPVSGAPAAVARVWVDLRSTKRATIYLVDERWERVLIRHVRVRDRTGEVTREEVAHIIEAAVEALLDGAQLGVTREEAHRELGLTTPERVAAPPPTPKPVERAHVGIGAFYELQTWSFDEPLFHGPGVALYGDTGSSNLRLGLWLSTQLRLPVEIEREPIGLHVQSGNFRLLGSLKVPISSKIWFRAGLGGGLDFVDIEPRVEENPSFRADPARLTLVPIARSMVFVGYALGERANAFLSLAADLDLIKTRYFVQRGESSETVFAPWRLRPALVVGVAADL
jgi:hypothetical protein